MTGDPVEVVAKLSARCFEQTGSLAAELIGALLAADLGLAVPEPLYVFLSPQFLAAIEDRAWAADATNGSLLAFGSAQLVGGYSVWNGSAKIPDEMVDAVAAAFIFDCATGNSDRRPDNPNCLRRGNNFYLIDHELCFPPIILGRPPAWNLGGLQDFEQAGRQIFADALRGRVIGWEHIRRRWKSLSDASVDGYGHALPPEWLDGQAVVNRAIRQIKQARDNVDGLIAEAERVLT